MKTQESKETRDDPSKREHNGQYPLFKSVFRSSEHKLNPADLQEIKIKLTKTILSHLAFDSMHSLIRNPLIFIDANIPDKIKLGALFGNADIIPTRSQLGEFIVFSIVEVIKELIVKKNRSVEEIQIGHCLSALQNRPGKSLDIRDIISEICQHFDIEIPIKYRLASSVPE